MVLKLLFMTLRIRAVSYTNSPLYKTTQIIYDLGEGKEGKEGNRRERLNDRMKTESLDRIFS